MALSETLPRLWYRRGLALPLFFLIPFSWLFGAIAAGRRAAYRYGWLRSERLPVPVVVVGNLVAGGAGKTPLTLWLVEALLAHGWRPGIVSRGYGVNVVLPVLVDPGATAGECGDEPLLLARRSGVPVAVCRDRVAAARAILGGHPGCNVIIADDGLQHYRLARDVELAVFDARGAGNGHLLPAGPLREPMDRLQAVDAVMLNGIAALPDLPVGVPCYQMRLNGARFVALGDAGRSCAAADLSGQTLHAYAGIGDPGRFFRHLEMLGLRFEPHPFPDHHHFSAADFVSAQGGVVLLTEKDAVKCAGLITGEAWVLPVSAEIDLGEPGLIDRILEKLNGRKTA
ncbi:MAG: tetraacyldisaccharide 4'-kinase [Rhodocyclaceae bacterium]